MGMIVRRLNASYAACIYDIEKQCLSNSRSCRLIENSLNNEAYFFFGVFDADGTLCGFADVSIISGEGYISNICVLPQYRRMGAGRLMVAALVELCKGNKLDFITLEVRPSNFAAIKLYQSAGFVREGMRRGYYDNPKEDALILTLRFGGKGDKNENSCS